MGTGYDAEWSIIIEGIEFERKNFFGMVEEILNNPVQQYKYQIFLNLHKNHKYVCYSKNRW